ncbi:4,5-DOPA-extradiol-dioxygenase [Anaerocolumna xylanovorans]|uniref:Aromatic ring-opening dioxygenase, catalytic subunit, LigB family n=1 Tax=Anaerocolumna xylanovorans DSM 12503 TaxID=1121345 RepID=A0A1M7XXJ5_9FIRM|nr:4,5-DOPA dioxygenase extradiol [Anaerocolumna xylanovorans]SHO43407.1 Aromatic ring-opening dioxygenase, catalytic subunit, LigB family [Anaerocolumna xylanovorans DSM 12503]
MKKVKRMPVLFAGHGSPMNAIEDNRFTRGWEEAARIIPRPKAILSVSAHWFAPQTGVFTEQKPRQIYDMYGFPRKLYELKYEPEGSPEHAMEVLSLLKEEAVSDNRWGMDHGTWSVLCKMYPMADIPVFQLSIDSSKDALYHYELGKKLAPLREEGVLILGSGNVVHHLGRVNWEMEEEGYPFAKEFDSYIKECLLKKDIDGIINYRRSKASLEAFPTPEHFYPLLYALGAAGEDYEAEIFNEAYVLGALSMTSYLLN